jgi:hypothetical protein
MGSIQITVGTNFNHCHAQPRVRAGHEVKAERTTARVYSYFIIGLMAVFVGSQVSYVSAHYAQMKYDAHVPLDGA